MGFRNKRRFRGGGGGNQQHHHHHGFGTGEANGLQPGDDVGNRRSFKPVQHPPEDLGNRKDPDEEEWVPEDTVGNRIDAAPTHELSGILLDLDGKRRRRRPKGVAAPERVGRYFVGGVNPLIATNIPRPFPGKTLEESLNGVSGQNGQAPHQAQAFGEGREPEARDVRSAPDGAPVDGDGFDGEDAGEGGGRRRRRRGRGREQVDGMAAQEVSERRAQRFFDFEEDDRFDYTLKSDAEQKRKDAEDAVRNIVVESGRDATVLARLIEDESRPKILVTIDERGPAASLPPERRAGNAQEPLFVMGNAALMSLNYLVNKIVNRYPDDRIRLAILPAADERLYLDALEEHKKIRGDASAAAAARKQGPRPVQPPQAAPQPRPAPMSTSPAALSPPPVTGPVPLAVVEVPAVPANEPIVVVTPTPVGAAAPREAFEEPLDKPEHLTPPAHIESAAVLEKKAAKSAKVEKAEKPAKADKQAEEPAKVDEAPAKPIDEEPKKAARPRRAAKKDDEAEAPPPAGAAKKPARARLDEAEKADDKKPLRPKRGTKGPVMVEKVVVKAPRSSK